MPELSFAVEQRLRFVDFLVAHYGSINRGALVDYFGISMPTASNDFGLYIELAPNNVTYDKSAKMYVRAESFARVWP